MELAEVLTFRMCPDSSETSRIEAVQRSSRSFRVSTC